MLFGIKATRSVAFVNFLVIVLLCFSSKIVGEEPCFVRSTWFCGVFIKNSIYYVYDYKLQLYDSFTKNDITYHDNGYCSVNLFGEECMFLEGGNAFFFKSQKLALNGFLTPRADIKFAPLGALLFKKPEFYTAGPFSPGVQSITASSYYSEKVGNDIIEYLPENMMRFFWTDETAFPIIHNDILPWVEGVSGSGIEEKLMVTFKGTYKKGTALYSKGVSDNIVILNGYVDVNRTELYKQNNRLKTIRITSTDPSISFSMDYHFKDVVAFHEIIFPEFVSGIEITILDVYPGSKWDDTCVTTVFTRLVNDYEGDKTEKLFSTRKAFQP